MHNNIGLSHRMLFGVALGDAARGLSSLHVQVKYAHHAEVTLVSHAV